MKRIITIILSITILLSVLSCEYIETRNNKKMTSPMVIATAANFQIISNNVVVYELKGFLKVDYNKIENAYVIDEYIDGTNPLRHHIKCNQWSEYIYDELEDIENGPPNADNDVHKTYEDYREIEVTR